MNIDIHREFKNTILKEAPEPLLRRLLSLDRRLLPHQLDQTIEDLCAWRPLSLRELARVLDRSAVYLQNTSLKRLLKMGRLVFIHPDEPNHPRQGYRLPVQNKGIFSISSAEEPSVDIGRND
jgi:ATP-dependent DNA helicase RecG